jgi:hypothetical protein
MVFELGNEKQASDGDFGDWWAPTAKRVLVQPTGPDGTKGGKGGDDDDDDDEKPAKKGSGKKKPVDDGDEPKAKKGGKSKSAEGEDEGDGDGSDGPSIKEVVKGIIAKLVAQGKVKATAVQGLAQSQVTASSRALSFSSLGRTFSTRPTLIARSMASSPLTSTPFSLQGRSDIIQSVWGSSSRSPFRRLAPSLGSNLRISSHDFITL